jgi:hypothetical protein
MKDEILANRWSVAIGIVICLVSVLAMPRLGVCSSPDDEQTGRQQPIENSREIDDMQQRADAQVREVNEATRAEIAEAEAVKRNRHIEEVGDAPAGKLLSDEELAAFEKQRAEKEKAVRARADAEIKSVKTQEVAAPESRTTENRRAEGQSRLPAPKSARGIVTGIVFCDNKGAALVNGEIVRENDTILGAKVVKILPDYVEFEKQGSSWKQIVGQTPPAFWPEQPSPSTAKQSPPRPKVGAGR